MEWESERGRLPEAAAPRRGYRPARMAELAQLVLRQEGQLWLRVEGASMLPLLRPDDWLRLVVAERRLRRGDLVVFHSSGDLVAHRLIARLGGRWTICGDNLQQADPPLSSEQILGRVDRMERAGQALNLDRPAWRVAQLALALLVRLRLKRPGGRAGRLLRRLQGRLLSALDGRRPSVGHNRIG